MFNKSITENHIIKMSYDKGGGNSVSFLQSSDKIMVKNIKNFNEEMNFIISL